MFGPRIKILVRPCIHVTICTLIYLAVHNIYSVIWFRGSGEIKKIKETHRLSVKIMKLCIKPISVEHYFDGGTNPWLTRYEDEDLSFIAAYRDIVSEYDIHLQEEKETPYFLRQKMESKKWLWEYYTSFQWLSMTKREMEKI